MPTNATTGAGRARLTPSADSAAQSREHALGHKVFEPNIYPNLGLLTLPRRCNARFVARVAARGSITTALLGDEYIRTYRAERRSPRGHHTAATR
jgi:hypothetical protein